MNKICYCCSEITTGQCGNGILDDGEDCDCGSDTTCESNPCCSSYTCRLRIDAECSSGPCCDNCKVIIQQTIFSFHYKEFHLLELDGKGRGRGKMGDFSCK